MYTADSVIVATGASALWLGLENETRLRGRGVSACATCDGFFFRGKKIAVVGGGDTALEEAMFLTRFASEVVLIHRRDEFRGSRIMQQRAMAHPGIGVACNSEVSEVLGRQGRGRPGTERHGDRRGVGRAPRRPLHRHRLSTQHGGLPRLAGRWTRGYLGVGEAGSAREGVFIAGDVHDHRYRQAITAAGDGCKAAMDAERWLEATGDPRSAARSPRRLVTPSNVVRPRATGITAGTHRSRVGPAPTTADVVTACWKALPALAGAGWTRAAAASRTSSSFGRGWTASREWTSTSRGTAGVAGRVPGRRPVCRRGSVRGRHFDVALSNFTVEHFADPVAAFRISWAGCDQVAP